MNSLENYLKDQPKTGNAVQQYAEEMQQKYPFVSPSLDEQVYEFRWVLSYFSNKTSATLTIIMMFVAALFMVWVMPGHEEFAFSTYHVFNKRQARHVRWIQFLNKQIIYTVAILRVISSVFLAILLLGLIAITLYPSPGSLPGPNDHPMPIPMRIVFGFFLIGCPIIFILGSAKVLAYLRTLGLPPGSNTDFCHRMISLRSVLKVA